ncbi:MAG TPA: hypothetical protein VJ761_21335 [Ktedonobacteraceae bacterium]|nr:hypothetical protein [Ktedonobacteraceae bacterium]
MQNDQATDKHLPDGSGTDNALAIESDEFQAAFGEPVDNTLDIDTWHLGDDLAAMYTRLEREIADAVEQGGRIRERIRSKLFPRAFKHPHAPESAGCYKVDVATIEQIHRGLLFNGGVEACDGTSMVHDTLPITLAQIGVSLVSYQGDQGTWLHRLYRRDLRVGGIDPIGEAMALLEQRGKRDSTDAPSTRDRLSDFTQRGIMAYAERAILLHKSQAVWRMGHGHPVPYELLTGGGLVINRDMPLLRYSMKMWRELLIENKRWVFVSSAPSDRVLLTLGDALDPLEFALVRTPLQSMRDIAGSHMSLQAGLKAKVQAFVEELGPQIVVGLYRASAQAPVRLFYAHRDCAHVAALIAMADSVLQEHRGFPMLIDLADMICRSTFGTGTFQSMIQQAYTEAGVPFRYLGERETR